MRVPESQNWGSGTYYGDASGGEYTQYSKLRRVGVSVVLCDQPGRIAFGISSNLPGDVQSVGRGELFALVLLLRCLEQNTQVEFVTDNYNVLKIYDKGRLAGNRISQLRFVETSL